MSNKYVASLGVNAYLDTAAYTTGTREVVDKTAQMADRVQRSFAELRSVEHMLDKSVGGAIDRLTTKLTGMSSAAINPIRDMISQIKSLESAMQSVNAAEASLFSRLASSRLSGIATSQAPNTTTATLENLQRVSPAVISQDQRLLQFMRNGTDPQQADRRQVIDNAMLAARRIDELDRQNAPQYDRALGPDRTDLQRAAAREQQTVLEEERRQERQLTNRRRELRQRELRDLNERANQPRMHGLFAVMAQDRSAYDLYDRVTAGISDDVSPSRGRSSNELLRRGHFDRHNNWISGSDPSHRNNHDQGRFRFIAQNIGFGVDDAIQSYQYGGMKASIRAASNNLTAVAATAIANPMIAAGTVIGLSAASAALPSLLDAMGVHDIKKETPEERYTRQIGLATDRYHKSQMIGRGQFDPSFRSLGAAEDLIAARTDVNLHQKAMQATQAELATERQWHEQQKDWFGRSTHSKKITELTKRQAEQWEKQVPLNEALAEKEELIRQADKAETVARREGIFARTEARSIDRMFSQETSLSDIQDRIKSNAKAALRRVDASDMHEDDKWLARRRITSRMEDTLGSGLGERLTDVRMAREDFFNQTIGSTRLNDGGVIGRMRGSYRDQISSIMRSGLSFERQNELTDRAAGKFEQDRSRAFRDITSGLSPADRMREFYEERVRRGRAITEMEGISPEERRRLATANDAWAAEKQRELDTPSGTRRFTADAQLAGSREDRELEARMVGKMGAFGVDAKTEAWQKLSASLLQESRDELKTLNSKLDVQLQDF